MNQKAAVTKDINARHLKILEGLLKLPENRECADCKSRAPRWASVNLGIFICLQCSGIHRSLGVHISKVRSATLDTWLPEQVALIQSMGNEKSNAYWEAELPPNYDRMQIENFIRAKYVEKRWVSKAGTHKMDLQTKEALSTRLRPRSSDGRGDANNHGHLYRERKSVDQSARLTKSGPVLRLGLNNQNPEDVAGNCRMSTSSSCSTSNSFSSDPHAASMQGNLDLEQQKVNSVLDAPETKPVITGSTYPSHVNKNDYTTQLFNSLSVGDSLQTTVTNTWVAFESDEGASPPMLEEKPELKKQSDTKINPEPERKNSIEESKSLVPFFAKGIQDADVKNETGNPSPKFIRVGVESVHHQRLAMLAPDDFIPVEEKACAVSETGVPVHMIDQPSSSSHVIHEPKQSNGHVIHPQQSSRTLINGQSNGFLMHQQQSVKQMTQSNGQLIQQPQQSSICAETHPQNWSRQKYSIGKEMPLAQVHTMGSALNQNAWSANSSSKNYSAVPLSAMSSNGHVNLAGRAVNGAVLVGKRTPSPVSSVPASGYDYDFSSLTQGFFKRQ